MRSIEEGRLLMDVKKDFFCWLFALGGAGRTSWQLGTVANEVNILGSI